MIKMYEVAPEHRENPIDDFDFHEGCCFGEVTVTGNRNYEKHETELYKLACNLHDDIMNYDKFIVSSDAVKKIEEVYA